mgnify:CR=1 FL=1
MISLILIILASFFNAVMDLSSEGKLKDKYNKNKTWKNKYKPGTTLPKFFGAKTFLVWTTDLWHFMKMLMLACLFCAIVFYSSLTQWGNDAIYYYKALDLGLFTLAWDVVYEWTRKVHKWVNR